MKDFKNGDFVQMKDFKIGDVVAYYDKYEEKQLGIIVTKWSVSSLIYHPFYKNTEVVVRRDYYKNLRVDPKCLCIMLNDDLMATDYKLKIKIEEKEKGETKMKDLESRIKELLNGEAVDMSDFIVQINIINEILNEKKEEKKVEEAPYHWCMNDVDKKYIAEFYKCYFSSKKFEDAFREDKTNNKVMRNLHSVYGYVNSYAWDEGVNKVKKAMFDYGWFYSILEYDIEEFEKFGDENHYRINSKCYVRGLPSLDYPLGFYQYVEDVKVRIKNAKIHPCYSLRDLLKDYHSSRKVYKGKIPYFYVSKMKAWMTYLAYREYLYKNTKVNVRKTLEDFDNHTMELISKGEEWKLYKEFETLVSHS